MYAVREANHVCVHILLLLSTLVTAINALAGVPKALRDNISINVPLNVTMDRKARKAHALERLFPAGCRSPRTINTDLRRRFTHRFKMLNWKGRIPLQLVITGRNKTFEDNHPAIREHIQKVVADVPGMKLRYIGDWECASYVREFYPWLSRAYMREPRGARRGDICRTVVLLIEGGFYMDMDVEPAVPLNQLIDKSTTFMSVLEDPYNECNRTLVHHYKGYNKTSEAGILNALIATEPLSEVLGHALIEMEKSYHGYGRWPDSETMGPMTLLRGVQQVANCSCPFDLAGNQTWMAALLELNTGLNMRCKRHSIRLYEQRLLRCSGTNADLECPSGRSNASLDGLKFGIFEPGSERRLVGWPHVAWCAEEGCRSGGHDDFVMERGYARPGK